MATQHDDVELEGVVENTSGKAVLFRANDWTEAQWIPRSQSELVMQPESDIPMAAIMYIRRWLCKKNGWVEE